MILGIATLATLRGATSLVAIGEVRVGAAPQVLATLRNLAISILRLNGFKSIAVGLRWVAWDHHRGLKLLGL